MKKSLMLYPYTYKYSYMVHYSQLVCDYSIDYCVEAKGNGYAGKSADIYNKDCLLKIRNDFSETLKKCDAVLFLSPLRNQNFMKQRIEKILDSNKAIIMSKKVYDSFGLIEFKNKITILEDNTIIYGKIPQIAPISIPAIAVWGIGEECDQFSVELAVGNYFRNRGYKVIQIGSSEFSTLFELNFYNVQDETKSFGEKVACLNFHIKQLEKKQKFSDIVVLGSKSSIMPLHFSDSNYGEESLITSYAINLDSVILCLPYLSNPDEKYLDYLRNIVKYKFSSDCEFYYISNTKLHIESSPNREKVQYLYLEDDMLKKLTNSTDLSCTVRSFDSEKFKQKMSKLEDKFKKYSIV